MMNDGGLARKLGSELAIARRDRLIREAVGKEVNRMILAVKTMGNGIDAYKLERVLTGVLKELKAIDESKFMR